MSGRRPPDSAILRYQRETADGTIHTYEPLVEERSNSLAGVLEIDDEVLRGVSLPSLLAGRAHLFASEGQAARDPDLAALLANESWTRCPHCRAACERLSGCAARALAFQEDTVCVRHLVVRHKK